MEPLRLDPADPLASVLRWLAALVQALGLDPAAAAAQPIRLNRASAAVVRAWLADWSRQLRVRIRAEAARLALRLRLTPRGKARDAAGVRTRTAGDLVAAESQSAPAGRVVAVVPLHRRRLLVPRDTAPRRADPAALLDLEEQAAIKRRTRAVLLALHDPGAAIARLARRLARAKAVAAAHPVDARFPRPLRVLGAVRCGLALQPPLRPPDGEASAIRPDARPAAPAAAAPALGGAGNPLGRRRPGSIVPGRLPLSLDAAAPLRYMPGHDR